MQDDQKPFIASSSQYTQQQYQQPSYENVIRTQVSTTQFGDSKVVSGGLTDTEGAKAIARRLFDTYDRDRNGQIDNVEVVPMIVDIYKSFNKIFSPSRGDIDSFHNVLDQNQDGRINYQDIEELCIKYLTAQQPSHLRTFTTYQREHSRENLRASNFSQQSQSSQRSQTPQTAQTGGVVTQQTTYTTYTTNQTSSVAKNLLDKKNINCNNNFI